MKFDARPGFVDRMVAVVSPERAVRRVAARAQMNAMTSLSASSPIEPGGRIHGRGAYNAANSDRRQTRGWFAKTRSANADYLGGQRTLIGRSRWATVNMPMATAAIERPIAFTIGSGLMAVPDLNAAALGISEDQARALTAQIAADYDEYMSSTDPDAERGATGYGLQEIVMRAVLEAGDVLPLRVMPEKQAGRISTTAWKLIEADWIASPIGHVEGERLNRGTGNVCVGGVELDEYGAPVAFHVLKRDPGSVGTGTRQAGDTVRIEAWGSATGLPTAVHVLPKRRPGQVRGVPMLAPVIELLKQISDLTEAELFAAVLTGMLAIVYKSPGAQPLPEVEYGIEDGGENVGLDQADNPGRNYRLESGSVLEIDSDADVDVKSPGRPNPAFDPFFQAMVRQLAAATEIPFEVLQMHFTASYTASRGALELMYMMVRRRREWMASMWCTPAYRCWLYEQVARGRYRMPGFLDDPMRRELWSRVRHRGDGKISMDPAREAKALEVQEAHAWRTGAEITAELTGGDYDANVRTRVGEHQRFVEGGLPIPNAKGGGASPAAEHDSARGANQTEEE